MAVNTFYLRIVSAKKIFFSGRCVSIIVPVAAHHENMVNAVENGVLKYKPEGADEYTTVVVGTGFAQIINNRVTVLVETAELPEEIDKARALEAKERAEEQMRQDQSMREYYHSRASLARAMVRLKATSGK